jgi:hypothetical protein
MKHSLVLSLIAVAMLASTAYSVSPTDHSFLLGTWVNLDSGTGGLLAFMIYEDGAGGLLIYSLGACSPPCQWGSVPCIPYASSIGSNLATGFTALYDFGWLQTQMAATQLVIPGTKYGVLQVTDFDFFIPPDTRTDYWSPGYFLRMDAALLEDDALDLKELKEKIKE